MEAMFMKKQVSIFCVLGVITALLCGCAVTPAPSESTADATTAPTTAATTTEATAAPTTEATTDAPTTTEVTTTVATTAPTTAPVTRPTFDPSIPVANEEKREEGDRGLQYGYFTFEGFEYRACFGQLETLRYVGDKTDVTIPHEVQYVYRDTLYTVKIPDASVGLFLDTSVKTVRWHPEVCFSPGSLGGTASPLTHLYLPLQLRDQERFATLPKIDLHSYWISLTNTSDGGDRHIYLIKGAPLTEALATDGLYNPYGWELDFSEEGTFCFYTQKDGKDDQPVYFHVAESFE